MSELTDLEQARQTLRWLAIVAIDAIRLLDDGLHHADAAPTPEQQVALDNILRNLTLTREGFILALKTSDLTFASELRDLIGCMVDWSWLGEIGLRWITDEPLERLGGQVILYQHALIALGLLPRLPSRAVTYPHGTYTDIPVPSTPGETLSRLEELEKTIWAASHEPVKALSRGAVRRTYGFFEATTWLISNHLAQVVGF